MLIAQNTIKPTDVVTIKLSTGDELLAKVKSINTDGVTVTKPMLVSLGMDKTTGQPGIQMLPFFVVSADPDSDFPIKNIHIITMLKCSKDIEGGYIQQTTGLTIARSF